MLQMTQYLVLNREVKTVKGESIVKGECVCVKQSNKKPPNKVFRKH